VHTESKTSKLAHPSGVYDSNPRNGDVILAEAFHALPKPPYSDVQQPIPYPFIFIIHNPLPYLV
jgi:hypothetical protein